MLVAIALLCVLALVVGSLLWYFGDVSRCPWYAQITAFVAWFFPFAIVLVLPLDLASTLHSKCLGLSANYTMLSNYTVLSNDPLSNYSLEASNYLSNYSLGDLQEICEEPLGFVPRDFLLTFWQIVYWTSQLLCWFVVPVMATYVRSGDFTLKSRLYNAVRDNLFYYALMAVAGVAFLIYMLVAVKFTREGLTAILMAAANAWGLLLCTCMLGYGLVEIPRSVWSSALPSKRLHHLESLVPKTREKMIDSEAEMYQIAREIATASHKVPDTSPLRVHVDLLLKLCPLALDEKVQADIERRGKDVTELGLRDLHARCKYGTTLCARHQAQYRFLLEKAWFLGDVVANQKSTDYMFKSVYFKTGTTSAIDIFKLRILWIWYIWLKPILILAFSVLFMIASVALIWSESTFQITDLPLSIPALLLKNNFVSYASLEFISISFLVYMCTCAYSTLFRINLFDYYVIVPEHCTDEPSLLFVGGYLCRLTFPLCYNFLNMVGDDQNSVFIEFQGKAIDLTPLLGDGFNTWVPLLVLLFSLITYFDMFGRIAGICCIGGRGFVKGREEGSNADAVEGRSVIAQARSVEERRSGGAFSSNPDRLRVGGTGAQTVLNTRELLAKYNRGGVAATGSSSTAAPPPPATSNASTAASILATRETGPSSKPAGGASFGGFMKGFAGFGAKPAAAGPAVGKYQQLGDEEEDELFIGQQQQQPPTAREVSPPIVVSPNTDSPSFSMKMFSSFGPASTGSGALKGGSSGTGGGSGSRVFGKSVEGSPVVVKKVMAPAGATSGPVRKRNMFDDL
ncbi:LMBR1 domain-containing protein 2 [Podochytrium sp. JEL0797]|nr:LMBR1 domain-containing protein 2 [Podochytrium sp. JEL0797]